MREEKLVFRDGGSVVYETSKVTQGERDAYGVLARLGFAVVVKRVDGDARAKGRSSLDMTIDGERWELKSPTGSNEKKTITRNINKAIQQCLNALPAPSAVRVALSCLETDLPRRTVEFWVRRKMGEGQVDELIVIYGGDDVWLYSK